MGVGGNFWDMLKPYARSEGPDFLRDKRVAVDLSYWIVQHDAAIRARAAHARSPHLRTTFFRTVALFSKMGAYPVFVVDGDPSPLKSQARLERFLRASGLDSSALIRAPEEGDSAPVKQRNQVFTRCVRECVRLKEALSKQRSSSQKKVGSIERSDSPKPNAIHLSITEFYRSTKVLVKSKARRGT